MEMKIPAIAITAVVVVIVLAGVLMPVLDDATATTDKFTNDGSFELTYNQPDEITLVWDHTNPGSITVNDESITMPTLNNGESRTVLCGDDWLVRFGYGTSLGGNYIQWYPSVGASILASVANGYDLTVTCSDGTVTVSDTASTPNTSTQSYSYFYCVADDGDYVMKNGADAVYVTGDTTVYAMGLTNVGTYTSTGIKIEGSIDDGMTWSIFRGSTAEFTNQEVNYTEVDNYISLYKLESMTATVTLEDQSVDAVYSYFIVPEEVTAERAEHFTDNQNAIFAAIPIMVIVALLIAVVALVFRGRDF